MNECDECEYCKPDIIGVKFGSKAYYKEIKILDEDLDEGVLSGEFYCTFKKPELIAVNFMFQKACKNFKATK
jgi:hypothetical protein